MLNAWGMGQGSGLVLRLSEKTGVNTPLKERVLCRMEVVSVAELNLGAQCPYPGDSGPEENMAT